MTEQDIARVAAGLTRAQRATLIWMGDDATLCRPDRRSIPALKRLGLVESQIIRAIIFDRTTKRGLAVRDHILREKSGG